MKKSILREIRNKRKKVSPKRICGILKNSYYTYCYEKLSIDENIVLLEAQHGRNVNGNIFYILRELLNNPKYSDFKIYITVTPKSKVNIKKTLNFYRMNNVNLVNIKSMFYYKILASAKFLINNTTFLPFYIKKEGQIYLNTWHGTPLKTLGKKIENEPHAIGNAQRNFLMSDYLLYPNNHTKNCMINDYMITTLYENNILVSGYPRNEVFFDKKARDRVRKELGICNKQVIAYMPTWRGNLKEINNEDFKLDIFFYLAELDKKLNNNQICYVNLHPFVADSICYNNFKYIKPFPKNYETYDFLNATDCLITDYSSVFFDYANTKNKIIIFDYDREDYIKTRGMYIDLDDLPFPKVNNVIDLVNEINSSKKYDDKSFLKLYCAYDNINAAKKLCEYIFNDCNIPKIKQEKKEKEKVLIYGGNLAKNGITSSLFSLLNNLDLNNKEYYLLINQKKIKKNIDKLQELPQNVNYFSFQLNINATIKERVVHKLYFKYNITNKYIRNVLSNIYKREFKRMFFNTKFDHVIHFSGYEAKIIYLLSVPETNKIIYVHSDMEREIKTRNNQHYQTLKFAYEKYDKVAVVSEDIKNSAMKIGNDPNKFKVVNNSHDYQTIIKKSQEGLSFDNDTILNIDKEKLEKILESKNLKFITIGRFSPEKGHVRLLKAFNKFWITNKNSYLIIIGGHGSLYEETIKMALQLECCDNIVIIKSLSNPFNILKKCDLFILSSYYEGLGLVILEADTLGIPVIATKIAGPMGFLKKHNGYLVDNSLDGIYQGMVDFLNDKVKVMNIDFAQYNNIAIQQFNELLK